MIEAPEQRTRQRIEAAIERLIALLDVLDGECDLEDNGDFEPSLGSTPRIGTRDIEYDLEWDTSDDELSGDEEEPKHGWSNPMGLRVHVRGERRQLQEQGCAT